MLEERQLIESVNIMVKEGTDMARDIRADRAQRLSDGRPYRVSFPACLSCAGRWPMRSFHALCMRRHQGHKRQRRRQGQRGPAPAPAGTEARRSPGRPRPSAAQAGPGQARPGRARPSAAQPPVPTGPQHCRYNWALAAPTAAPPPPPSPPCCRSHPLPPAGALPSPRGALSPRRWPRVPRSAGPRSPGYHRIAALAPARTHALAAPVSHLAALALLAARTRLRSPCGLGPAPARGRRARRTRRTAPRG